MQFVVTAWDGTDADAPARRLEVRPSHLEGIRPLVQRGNILVGGAILDDAGTMIGSVLLTDFDTREDLDAWLSHDPYVTGGVWVTIDVRPYRVAVGAWLPASEDD
jgi:uncharacterized protein YciI